MQKINYNEKILLEDNIKELLLINIDDKLSKTEDNNIIKIIGEITISGEANCDHGILNFNHPLDVDITISKEQLESNDVNVTLDDFEYTIKGKHINIDLIMKIEGLKEIEAYFPSQENQENSKIDEREENDTPKQIVDINEEATEPKPMSIETTDTLIIEETLSKEIMIENTFKEPKSLLKQIFRSQDIKKESTYLFHSIKKETTYQEIASLYGVNLEKLKKINNDEEIYIGKLILIPKD